MCKEEFRKYIFKSGICNPLYYLGNRFVNIIHSQLRMNCSGLNAHLFSLHVIDSPNCLYCHKVENTQHFFFDCPKFFVQRKSLKDIFNAVSQFSISVILHGDENLCFDLNEILFSAVHDYIKDSGRFKSENQ